MKVQLKQKNENPFYGMSQTLRLFQQGSKGIVSSLDSAWAEAKTKEQKELFWSLLFSFGDVSNRQHVEFESKVDNGGFAQREYFRDTVLPWAWKKVKSEGLDKHRFLELVVQYTTLDNLVAARVKTQKKTKKVLKVINMIDVFGIENIVPVLTQMYHGSEFDKYRLARFLVGYTFSRRDKMLPETIKNMKSRKALLEAFVKAADLGSIEAYKSWKRGYTMESHLFSTGQINDYDKDQFLELIRKTPGNARHRIKTRLYNEKWAELNKWFTEWEEYKQRKQKQERELTEKVRQGTATEEDKVKLRQVKKEAKVNSSSKSFEEAFQKIMKGDFDPVSMHSMMNVIELFYNTLVITDVSGSMKTKGWSSYTKPYLPIDFAAFMATVCMLKNPDDEASNLLGMFATHAEFINGNAEGTKRPNSILRGSTTKIKGAIVDRTKPFEWNFERVKAILAARSGGSTDVSSIFKYITDWVKKDPSAVDELAQYPVWTLISDGEFNNRHSVLQSLLVGQKKMEQIVGFAPFIILIDVAHTSSTDIRNLEGAENIMVIPPNPGAIEQVLTNFKDIDVRDVFTPLLGIYRSNRYAPVREWAGN